jgi:phosphoglycerate dehydrogenase-like enzyme
VGPAFPTIDRRPQIAVHAPSAYGDAVIAALREVDLGDVVICGDAETCVQALAYVDVLCINGAAYDAAIASAVASAQCLRWIQFLSSGTDGLLRHGGARAGIAITNAAEAIGPIVAEHAIALALALLRAIPQLEEGKRTRTWVRRSVAMELASLDGATVVVIGYGAIGRAIVDRALAFGARCIVVRRTRVWVPAIEHVTFADLDDALPAADVVFVAVPLNAETHGLLTRKRLELLGPHSRVVNVARSAVVETAALVEALQKGRLAGAALDVFDTEPLASDDPLWPLRNVLISPHVAGLGGFRAAERMAALCVRNLRAFVGGTLGSP